MNYKVQKVLKNNKKYLILFIILWLFLDIVLIAPFAVGVATSQVNGKLDVAMFFENFIIELTHFTAITKIFAEDTIGVFAKGSMFLGIVFIVFILIGLFKSRPKNEFTDIEHGSSDWSEGGEQYRILNKKHGMILAENNYLPLDKMGNINVLVVGRFRFW